MEDLVQDYYGSEGTVWLIDGNPHVVYENEYITIDGEYIYIAGLIPIQEYLNGIRAYEIFMPLPWMVYALDDLTYLQNRGLKMVIQSELTRVKEVEWVEQGYPSPSPDAWRSTTGIPPLVQKEYIKGRST